METKEDFQRGEKTGQKQGQRRIEGSCRSDPGRQKQSAHRLSPSSTVDVMLDSTFESAEALKAYSTHPKHVAVADSKVRPYTAVRSCMDYEI